MWNCHNCGEKLEDQFDSCWNCAVKVENTSIKQRPDTRSNSKTTYLVLLGGLIFLILFVAPLAYKFFTHSVYKSASPAGLGSACFFKESDAFVSTIDLYVKDYKKSRFDLERVGTVSGFENGPSPQKAVWSRDGAVVAVISGNVKDSQRGHFWTHAYDFVLHKKYGSDLINIESDQETPIIIKNLLDSHGGEGQAILSNTESFKSRSRPYYPWELFPTDKFP
jgi:hypothetical protein